jgi:predicted ABC-type ATPase
LKKIIIIAGPNGAGKTTFAKDFLPREAHTLRFINADLIAAGLAPFNPEVASIKAARIMLKELNECASAEISFAFETTLAGLKYLKRIDDWKRQGYIIKICFISLQSVDLAISRVAERVKQGGHNISEETIRRRFASGIKNFNNKYKDSVNSWAMYDGTYTPPKLIEWSN